jgi:hypothetical protein
MPNPTFPASAIALPVSRRFLVCSMVAAPVALAPALRGLATGSTFDPVAFVAAIRGAGVTMEPCHALSSYFIGHGASGFGDAFFAVSERFTAAYKADPRATEKVYLALCAEDAGHD